MDLNSIRYSDVRNAASIGEIEPVTMFEDAWIKYAMDPPPTNASAKTLGELDRIEALVRTEYPLRQAEIERQDRSERNPNDPEEEGIIEKEFYTLLASRNVSVPKAVRVELSRYNIDLTSIVLYYKNYFDRARPFQLFNELGRVVPIPVSETAHSPAYPSGHALIGRFSALYLSDLYPMHSASLTALGDRIGANRVVAGFHYPSDTVAGQRLADALWDIRNV